MTLLNIKHLKIEFPTRRETLTAVQDLSLSLSPGEILGVVGESGAGKSTIGNAIMDLLPPPGRIPNGVIEFDGVDLIQLDAEQMRKMRGARIGMIFQDPQTSLNPLVKIGKTLVESIRNATPMSERNATEKARELLDLVGIPHPVERMNSYPHELSGGMRQRVVIALAMCGDPDLIIADEPTTALDVSIQKQILDLIRRLCKDRNLSVILITHDIGVIAEIADRVAVMKDGEVLETGTTNDILGKPEHPYTKSLIAAVPRADVALKRFATVEDGRRSSQSLRDDWQKTDIAVPSNEPAIEVKNLNLSFTLKRALRKRNQLMLHAVNDVSFSVTQGETFGLVGESGSGKSTVARLIAGLYPPDSGQISLLGHDVTGRRDAEPVRTIDRKLQMIFQDPYSSLNGRMRVEDIIAEPIAFYELTDSRKETHRIVKSLLDYVGLPDSAAKRYPHEFSGGQRQRISIARAIAARPKILICDEPTSALDVSIQAQILNLLKDLQDEFNLTMLLISHDLPVIRQMCDNVAVMRQGKIVEIAPTEQLFDAPKAPYTQELIRLIPRLPEFNLSDNSELRA